MRAYSHGSVKVEGNPTLICSIPPGILGARLYNAGNDRVYIGSADVAPSGERMGIPLAAGEQSDFPSYEHDCTDVYAVAGKVSSTVVFLVLS